MASGTERHSSNVIEKFAITVKMKDGTLQTREVEGYRVSIHGCPDAKLFVHRSITNDQWCVTEEESGFQICTGASKPAAVGRARRRIMENYDKWTAAVKNAVKSKKSGKAPVDAEIEEAPEKPVTASIDKPVKMAAKPKK